MAQRDAWVSDDLTRGAVTVVARVAPVRGARGARRAWVANDLTRGAVTFDLSWGRVFLGVLGGASGGRAGLRGVLHAFSAPKSCLLLQSLFSTSMAL